MSSMVDDGELVERARGGDETAFEVLVRRHHPTLLRLARMYVASDATAEEVAQETWVAVLEGLGDFEGRSSFRTWCLRILMNIARRRGTRDSRVIPFSSTTRLADDPYGGAVDPEQLNPPHHPIQPLHWVSFPRRWEVQPDDRAAYAALVAEVESALDGLSPAQREVFTLRDVLGWTTNEAAELVGISEANARVLLHRGRSRVRKHLEAYLNG